MLTFKNIKKLNLYNSLDTLKILTFWKIIQDKCILYLDFDYYDGKKYTNDQKHEIEQLWHRLYDEYYLLINDAQSKAKIDKTFKEGNTVDLIKQLKSNADFLTNLYENEKLVKSKEDAKIIVKHTQSTYKRLENLDKRIKLKYFESIPDNIKVLNKYINALINQYNRNADINKDSVNNEINNIYKVVASAESWLERNLIINDMVCSHWVAIMEQVKNKQKAGKNGK